MVFNSIEFLLFFPIVICIYYVIPKALKKYWLLIASYYFYMSWEPRYAILILVSTVITYLSGILLERSSGNAKRNCIVVFTLVTNLGILFTFKYLGFAIENINRFIGIFGASKVSYSLKLLLPVGISFYTFQALSYTIDVYRGTVNAEKNFVKYALFISFFPQLVAGPIERSGKLLTQISVLDNKKLFDYEKTVSGFSLMCYGMFLKVVLADHLAIFVDNVWDNLQAMGLTMGILAAVGFSFQIYCDFGAYSSIAIGAARMLGIDLMENFNTPYFAVSIADFWRRWHISLSTWFRDYLYIPLGGSRCSKLKKYRNILITFLISGLWHGANWTYVVWGLLHGIYQVMGDITKSCREKICGIIGIDRNTTSFHLGQVFWTFVLTTLTWVFFRADSLSESILFFKNMIKRPDPWVLSDGTIADFGLEGIELFIILLSLLVLFTGDIIRYRRQLDVGEFLLNQNLLFRWLVLIGLIVATAVYGAYGIDFNSSQFIYFQF